MNLPDIGIILADTSRSRAYLRALVRNNLLPNFALVLEDDSGGALPGQVKQSSVEPFSKAISELDDCWAEINYDHTFSIKSELNRLSIPYKTSLSKDINIPLVLDILRQREESVFIYSGFGGALLRKDILSLGKHFLHVHGGYLPAFKGSTTNYYSLLVENTIGASSIFLSEEIDSGPILMRQKFPAPTDRQGIDHIYDSAARSKVLIDTLNRYVAKGEWEFDLPNNVGGETYYIIHPVLKHIAILDKENVSK